MSIKVFKTLSEGRRYMKTWPLVRQLSFYFPEYRVIRAMSIALPLMPILAVVAAISQLSIHGLGFLPQAITIAAFFISLPLQGLLWLGWRSRHPLPLSLLEWGNSLSTKLTDMGVYCQPLGAKACYFDMAMILKAAFERLDASYWEEL
ncbi:terminus macrodomain insulation protein YfbV [uncultured Shewanella sp.]|uniref:terminus macrodomain insulation protein YfbV n=1 Tax=uncultured Shewanella sp. TaxID=173975 RepID=UPI002637F28C|nr:terminus macrodomain insulation protein YfbV [uncultured Shewanella sp.]